MYCIFLKYLLNEGVPYNPFLHLRQIKVAQIPKTTVLLKHCSGKTVLQQLMVKIKYHTVSSLLCRKDKGSAVVQVPAGKAKLGKGPPHLCL